MRTNLVLMKSYLSGLASNGMTLYQISREPGQLVQKLKEEVQTETL
jgi:hypothetical protein